MYNGKRIYLACPYTSNKELGYYVSLYITSMLMMSGINIYSPLVNSVPIEQFLQAHCGTDLPADQWLSYDFKQLNLCDELWVVKIQEWERSVGVSREIEYANINNIPVKYVTLNGIAKDRLEFELE